jgi:basic membrane lipoprotein Med (substrate-binding protein (PBP1-ABC) superfamily)/DNA-binding SARP family transcriptional activator
MRLDGGGIMVEWRLLGPLEVLIDGNEVPLGAPKQRALLITLLLHPNQVVSVDRIIDDVWGERAPRTAQHSVQLYVSELRKALGDDRGTRIVTRSPGYELKVDPEAIDSVRFERLVDAGVDVLVADPVAAVSLLEEALELWRGPALVDVAYEDFAQSEIRRLDELRLDAEDALDESRLWMGGSGSLVARLRRRAEDHPLRERTRGLYMQALAGHGRQADALRTFQDLRRRLGEELGIDPSPELCRLEERILLQDPMLAPASDTRAVSTRNPYKGLRPFLEADAADFYGRAQLTARLASALEDARFVTAIGPSGSGKSSVLRAGLIPELRNNDALVPVVMVPGEHPFAALRVALDFEGQSDRVDGAPDDLWLVRAADRVLNDDETLVVLIDQFEELYTLSDEEESRSFIASLSRAALEEGCRVRIVAAMRADYYDRPLRDPDFGPLFTSRVVHVTPMTMDELESAATEPATRAGLTIEPALLSGIIADSAGQPGGLPLFQFTLTELADRTEGAILTAETYRNIGGLKGGLIGRAEEAMSELTKPERDAARQLALRLVTLGDQSIGNRRRVEAVELTTLDVDAVALRSALERLGRHRLVTFDHDPVTGNPTVEFAHDALLETWDRLQGWIEESREDLRRRASLSVAIVEWIDAGRDPDFLPAGAQLETYEAWRETSSLRLTTRERDFLDAAERRASEAREAERRRLESERRLHRRARLRLWALVAVSAVLVGAAVTAFVATRLRGPEVALVFQGRGDESIGDLLAQGWDRAGRDLTFRGIEISSPISPAEELATLADSGYELVIGASMFLTEAIVEVASEHQETDFVVIDQEIDLPNVTSFVFAHSEGSFLAGAAAALASRTGVVGFVGGLPLPIIEEFRAGFEAGARFVDPTVVVLAIYLTLDFDTHTAFMRPDLGFTAGAMLYEEGADVVFHAAAVSGWGVVDAAGAGSTGPDDHLWVIGVDSDQYVQAAPEQRPFILTSMVKQFDVAVERALHEFIGGSLGGGTRVLGFGVGGVRLATTGDHLAPYTDELARIEALIVAEDIEIPRVPTGPLIPMPQADSNVTLRITYGPEACTYEGPDSLSVGDVAEIGLVNNSGERAFLGLIPLAREVTLEEAGTPTETGEPPDFLLIFESVGEQLDPGIESSVVTPPFIERSYLVVCTGAVPHPAAIIAVG